METKLTIIVQTYNRKNELENCLLSLQNQSDKNFKILIFGNGATYDLNAVAEATLHNIDYEIISLRENKGLVFGRNESVKYVKTEFFGRIDDDDNAPVDYVHNANKEIDLNHDVIFVNRNNSSEINSSRIYLHEPWRYIIKKSNFIEYPNSIPEDIHSSLYYCLSSNNPSIGKVFLNVFPDTAKNYIKDTNYLDKCTYWTTLAWDSFVKRKENICFEFKYRNISSKLFKKEKLKKTKKKFDKFVEKFVLFEMFLDFSRAKVDEKNKVILALHDYAVLKDWSPLKVKLVIFKFKSKSKIKF